MQTSHHLTAVPDDRPALAFGPIPSRRLGHSLGVNNIPPKVCSYSCVYCQVGATTERAIEPREFYPPKLVAAEVAAHVARVRERGGTIDHLSFVPDGEPTLDAHLGEAIDLLRPLGIDIAVFTNATLLWRPDVRAAVARADWVSVKVDAATEHVWRRVNRPHPSIGLDRVLEGIRCFSTEFGGELVSETMLVDGVNDGADSVAAVGAFLHDVGIATAYLAIPTRPTPYPDVTAPDEETVTRAFHVLAERVPRVQYLIGYEGDEFASTGDARADLLAITAVQPMRASAVDDLLRRSGAGRDLVAELVADGQLAEVDYRGSQYLVRRWRPRRAE